MNTTPSSVQQTVPILDFGAQYVQLIARRVREAGVYSILVKPDISVQELRAMIPVAIAQMERAWSEEQAKLNPASVNK